MRNVPNYTKWIMALILTTSFIFMAVLFEVWEWATANGIYLIIVCLSVIIVLSVLECLMNLK